ncbi:MAG: membrane integrity-associated transporter subunit PqiC [Deltaproteobacteria bacterium]|nr:membrane integrity-associated transporter subunit PqiC [Deltaproteobacteria bacterium]
MQRTIWWRALLCEALASCGLLSNAPPLEIRYFQPPTAGPKSLEANGGTTPLELGRVTPSAHLRYEIVYRGSPVELALYDALRWSERPDTYVRRALIHELFEVRSMVEAVSGSVPTLEVEVLAFEEVRHGERRAGHVQLRYKLAGSRAVLASGVISVERPASSARIEAIVEAIGAALTAASAELADVVEATLARPKPKRTDPRPDEDRSRPTTG